MFVLNSKDRVLKTIRHQQTDRIPRGELLVEASFLDRLYPYLKHASYIEKMKHLAIDTNLDLITIQININTPDDGLLELGKWAAETPYFIMALIDGLFWKPEDSVSFESFILGLEKDKNGILDLLRIKTQRIKTLIQRSIDKGADGIIIGDDLAYDGGPFISPDNLKKFIFPGLQEMAKIITRNGKTAFLHSCGNLTQIIDLILSAGFIGVHGLSTFSGNDPLAIRKQTRNRLAFMGIFEVDRLIPKEIETMKKELIAPLSKNGGYILGSAGGLSVYTPLDSFRALYDLKFEI